MNELQLPAPDDTALKVAIGHLHTVQQWHASDARERVAKMRDIEASWRACQTHGVTHEARLYVTLFMASVGMVTQ